MSNWRKFKRIFYKPKRPSTAPQRRYDSMDNINFTGPYSLHFLPLSRDIRLEEALNIIESTERPRRFSDYTINELKTSMLDFFNNDEEIESLTFNQMKELIRNEFDNEQYIGAMCISGVREKFYEQAIFEIDDLKIQDVIDMMQGFENHAQVEDASEISLSQDDAVNINENEMKDVAIAAAAAYDKDICKICIENEINCVFIECGHLMVCLKCSQHLDKCPFCRQNITRVLKIYRV